jgi:DNA processing protein
MSSLFDLLVLSRIPRVGPIRLRSLVNHCGSPSAALAASPGELARAPGWNDALARAAWESLRRDRAASGRFACAQISTAERAGARIITLWDAAYPELLSRIDDPPPALYVAGGADLAGRVALALVGSRMPTPYGRAVAAALAGECAACGITVVSGLARGVDTAAHAAALASGGSTLAVLGSGVDVVYPPENAGLAASIRTRGALISEFPMGTRPDRPHFPQRNRIISGLARGTIVVESDIKGGAMITARFALEQNREVFAVPGPAGAPMSRGCNALIREGRAKLVERLEDVLVELAPAVGRS